MGQRQEGPAITTHWAAAQGVSIHTRGVHALATPGFSTLLLAILPSSTAAQERKQNYNEHRTSTPHKVRTLRQKRKVRRPSWHSQQVAQAHPQLVLLAARMFDVKTALSANALEPGHGRCQLDCLKSISF